MSMSISPRVDFLIITALEEERDAVLLRLPGYQQIPASEADVRIYYEAVVEATQAGGARCDYQVVVVCLSNMGRVQATVTASDAIRRWQPSYVLLVGIAGGLKSAGVDLGDILIAEQIADYESQKITNAGSQIRWSAHPVDQRLLEFSRGMAASVWQTDIRENRPEKVDQMPKRHQGTITTGDKVIAVTDMLESFKSQNWPKLIGVEMEAGGVVVSAHQSAHRPGFFMIRCVSDQAGNKASKKVKAWRPYACDVAAAFAVAMIRNGPIPPKRPNEPGSGQPDDLAIEMSKLTFGELEMIMKYVVGHRAVSGVDFTLLSPEEKLERNGLGEKTHDQLVLGLSKVQLVGKYVEHQIKLDANFSGELKAGFLAAYRRLSESDLDGDELFDRLANFACNNDHRTRYRAAALAVLTYLFEICDVFEK
jgi:nucleoside phosphorylase